MMRLCLVAVLATVLVGCDNPEATLGGVGEVPTWEALSNFQGEPLMKVSYPKEMGDWASVKRELSSPEFEAALNAFDADPIPDAYANDKDDKEAAVAAFRAAIEAAKSGNQEEMKTQLEAATTALSKVSPLD